MGNTSDDNGHVLSKKFYIKTDTLIQCGITQSCANLRDNISYWLKHWTKTQESLKLLYHLWHCLTEGQVGMMTQFLKFPICWMVMWHSQTISVYLEAHFDRQVCKAIGECHVHMHRTLDIVGSTGMSYQKEKKVTILKALKSWLQSKEGKKVLVYYFRMLQ